MQERIWKDIASMHTPGFFVTAEMQRVGKLHPHGVTIERTRRQGEFATTFECGQLRPPCQAPSSHGLRRVRPTDAMGGQ